MNKEFVDKMQGNGSKKNPRQKSDFSQMQYQLIATCLIHFLTKVVCSLVRLISKIFGTLCDLFRLRFYDAGRSVDSHIFHDQYANDQQAYGHNDDQCSAHGYFPLKTRR